MTGSSKNKNQKLKSPPSKSNIYFELCGCKSEVLVLEYDKEIGLMDLAIYEHTVSFTHKMNLGQKLRYIWQVLRYNRPFNDQIVLDKKQIKKLMLFLERSLDDK